MTNEIEVKRFMCAVQWELGHSPATYEVYGIKPDGKVAWTALCQFLLDKAGSKGPHRRVAMELLVNRKALRPEYVKKGHYKFDPGLNNSTYDVRIMEL